MTHAQREQRALDAIRDRLNIPTADLSRDGLERALRMAHKLTSRLSCESWGRSMGWDRDKYRFGGPLWSEMYAAWLDDSAIPTGGSVPTTDEMCQASRF